MPTLPCNNRNRDCLPCNDPPVINLSAEAEDRNLFLGVSYDNIVPDPPLGWWGEIACNFHWVWSSVSQTRAQQLAAAIECPDPPPNPPPPCVAPLCPPVDNCTVSNSCPPDGGGGGGGGGGGFVNGGSFANEAQSCTVECPNGDVFTHSVPAGIINSPLSQAHANALALGICQTQAQLMRICFNTLTIPDTCVNVDFLLVFDVSGGTAPYHYTATGIPAGMVMSDNGVLSGIPTTGGVYTVTVTVTDSSSPAVTAAKVFSFLVAQIATTTLPAGNVAVAYSQTLLSTPAGMGTWTVVSGTLPPGLALDGATGNIAGTPTIGGTYDFVVGLQI